MVDNNLQPWIGLDSYDEQNSEIFYGRAEEIKEILSSISYNTQTVIYGPSGIGKSSIIKAGIFPKVRENYYLPIYVRLNHNDNKSYPSQVIQATKEELEKQSAEIENILKITDNEESSLWEFFQSNNFWSKDDYPLTPLIVIDQFEEIFTLAKRKQEVDSFFEQLFDLVNNYIPKYVRDYISESKSYVRFSDEINYKLVVILREDFLGKLEDYDAKYPSLRKNRYSLQPINEEQAKDIILKPGGELVDIAVAKEIIKKITNEAEFEFDDIPEITVEPALLSLFCTELNTKRKSQNQSKISLKLIEEFGDDIIKEFYQREITKVDKSTVEFLENKLLTSSGFRDSVAVEDSVKYGITQAERETLEKNRIIRICERDGLRRIEYTHDILCKVAQENKLNRNIESERVKNKRKGRINSLTILFLLVFVIASSMYIYLRYFKEYIQYSSLMVKQNGFWKGLDNLNEEQTSHRSYYYKLSKKGSKGPFTFVEAYDGYGNLTTDHGLVSILLDQWDNNDAGANPEAKEKIKKMCKWRFIKGKEDEIIREDAFDKDDNLLWSSTHTQIINAGNYRFVYCRFTDDKQLPFIQREKGISNIRKTFDSSGNIVLFEYYDNDGNPAKNSWNAYGDRREYNDKGQLIKQASLNEFGEYMTDRASNTGQIIEYDDKGNMIKATSFGEDGEIIKVKDGYAIARYEYDKYGNITKILYFDESDKPCKAYDAVYGIDFRYNEKGKLIKSNYLDLDGNSVIPLDHYYSTVVYDYDKYGNKISEGYFDYSGRYYNLSEIAKKTFAYDEDKLIESKNFKYDEDGDTLKLTYHYKLWLDKHRQEILKFWHDPDAVYINYFEKSTFNKEGDQNSLATYEYPLDYHKLDVDNNSFWDENRNSMVNINYQKDNYLSFHKWIDMIDYNDTTTILRTFIDSVNTILKYKETTTYNELEITNKYLDTLKNIISATKLSHNAAGYISAISYTGISGIPFRNPNYLYGAYKIKYAVDNKGNELGYAAYNEYGERSYARYYSDYDKKYKVFHKYDKDSIKYFDIDGEEIIDMDQHISELNKLYFIYLKPDTDIEAKKMIQDGDIIVGYGNWQYDGYNIPELVDEYGRIFSTTKKVTLLRLPEEKLIEIEVPSGDYNVDTDAFYLTQKEHDRILKIIGVPN